MIPFLVIIISIIFLNLQRKAGKVTDKVFCIIICTEMILVSGLRHVDIGLDTCTYYISFLEQQYISFETLMAHDFRDSGYYLLSWIIANTVGNFTVLLMMVACTLYIPLTIVIYKYSDDKGLSFLTMMAFNFFHFSMTGVRQNFALGFTIMCMLCLMKEKTNYVGAIITMILAFYMHRSSVLVLLIFASRFIKNKKRLSYAILFSVPVTFVFRSAIASVMESIEFLDFEVTHDNAGGAGSGITTYLVFLILFIWGMFFTYKDEDKTWFNIEATMPSELLAVFGVGAMLQCFTLVSGVFFRLVFYFSIYMVIYIPRLVRSSKISPMSTRAMELLMYGGLLFMYFAISLKSAGVYPYKFFWQW